MPRSCIYQGNSPLPKSNSNWMRRVVYPAGIPPSNYPCEHARQHSAQTHPMVPPAHPPVHVVLSRHPVDGLEELHPAPPVLRPDLALSGEPKTTPGGRTPQRVYRLQVGLRDGRHLRPVHPVAVPGLGPGQGDEQRPRLVVRALEVASLQKGLQLGVVLLGLRRRRGPG